MRYLVFLLFFLAGPLWAQQSIVLRTLDVQTSLPAPPWTEFHRIAADSESQKWKRLSPRGTDLYQRTYVPKGQTFEAWEERYEVLAETPVTGDAEAHRNDFANHYQRLCKNAVLAPIVDDPRRQVFVLYCPSYQHAPETGEMVIAVSERQKETIVRVNYHLRVPAFDLMDRASFPKSRAELRDLVMYLNAAHLLPS